MCDNEHYLRKYLSYLHSLGKLLIDDEIFSIKCVRFFLNKNGFLDKFLTWRNKSVSPCRQPGTSGEYRVAQIRK